LQQPLDLKPLSLRQRPGPYTLRKRSSSESAAHGDDLDRANLAEEFDIHDTIISRPLSGLLPT
jgi:hypothetical protein